MNVVICDYGVGNITSVINMFRHFSYEPVVSSDLKVIDSADLLVLPGQGAFSSAMTGLIESGLVDTVKSYIADSRPFLGICVGFQVLFEGSSENGFTEGLGVFPGTFKSFVPGELKVPHMGWNSLAIKQDVFDLPVDVDPYAYFVHSYYLESTDDDLVFSETEYGVPFVSSIARPNLFATQFHPEKSGDFGLSLIRQFLNFKMA